MTPAVTRVISLISVPALLAALSLLVVPTSARADNDETIEAFVEIKKDVESLRQDPQRRKFRHNYERLIVKLQSVANTHKKGARADDCAYVAAQLLEELATVSVVSADRDAAVDAFESMATRFPRSNLADDALLAAARLTDDIPRGRDLLDRVLAMKSADMKREAKQLRDDRFNDAAVKGARQKIAVAQKSLDEPARDGAKGTSDAVAKALARLQGDDDDDDDNDDDHAGHGHDDEGTSKTATSGTSGTSGKKEKAEPNTTVLASNGAPPTTTTKQPVLVLPERPPEGTPSRKIMVIRHETTATASLVRLRISGEVGVLKGDVPAKNGEPRRVFYDVAPARLGQRNIQPIDVHDGTVARVRAGQYDVDVVRLVIELEGTAEPRLMMTRKPFELVLESPLPLPKTDIVAGAPVSTPAPVVAAPVDVEEVKARLSQAQDKVGAAGTISISQQLGLRVHRVVIDAGHGGHDTGAIGPSGVKEKDITLQIAQRVKAKLNAELPDVEVIMTRDDDRTLALQDRTNTANTAAADLFISIHCNASPIKRVRGVETYYLNITHDRYAMRLAARENAELGEGSISDLDFILADLAMKSNVDDSVRLGRSVQQAMMKKLKKNWSDAKDLGLKHALFFVLMGNKMPSILVETSFLSNKTEERRLKSAEYQEALANGVVDGVRAFVAERQAFYTGP